jgi:hypothetical protein
VRDCKRSYALWLQVSALGREGRPHGCMIAVLLALDCGKDPAARSLASPVAVQGLVVLDTKSIWCIA